MISLKKERVMRHETARLNPEDFALSGISQPQKEKHYLSPSTRELPGIAKSIMTEGRMAVALATGDSKKLFGDPV